MFLEQLSFRFSIVTFAILFACSNTADGLLMDFYANLDTKVEMIFNEMLEAKGDIGCVLHYWNAFQQCYDTMKNSWLALKDEGGSDPDFCCGILKYRDCVKKISSDYCGSIADLVVDKVVGPMRYDVSQCDGFLTKFTCWF